VVDTDSVEQRWLDTAGNRGEWKRVERALELSRGFALFVVDVPDVETEDRVCECLSSPCSAIGELDAREGERNAPVNVLLREQSRRYVIRTVEASRRDRGLFVECLAQLNQRRDQVVKRGHCVLIIVRRSEVSSVPDIAPDLYSIHRARFRFARLAARGETQHDTSLGPFAAGGVPKTCSSRDPFRISAAQVSAALNSSCRVCVCSPCAPTLHPDPQLGLAGWG